MSLSPIIINRYPPDPKLTVSGAQLNQKIVATSTSSTVKPFSTIAVQYDDLRNPVLSMIITGTALAHTAPGTGTDRVFSGPITFIDPYASIDNSTIYGNGTEFNQYSVSGTAQSLSFYLKNLQVSIPFGGAETDATFSVTISSPADAITPSSPTTVTASVVETSAAATQTDPTAVPITAGAVYRFFDNKFGTHFFTADAAERNVIAATRPDLVQETNDFGAVQINSPFSTLVHRFFDTVHGTHFFTANASEYNTVLNTRQDLVSEPNGNFYERGVQQAGDVAVYRFFDTKLGTHFYTGDHSEYTGITTPGSGTYRSDLTYEGIEFYAPSGTFK